MDPSLCNVCCISTSDSHRQGRMMDGETVATLKALMEWEGSPDGLPQLSLLLAMDGLTGP